MRMFKYQLSNYMGNDTRDGEISCSLFDMDERAEMLFRLNPLMVYLRIFYPNPVTNKTECIKYSNKKHAELIATEIREFKLNN